MLRTLYNHWLKRWTKRNEGKFMDEIEIKINKRSLERLAYAIVIIALLIIIAVLLFRDCDCKSSDGANNETPTGLTTRSNTTNETTQEVIKEPEEQTIEPTCDDRKKNGDETDVDCGGSDCGSCAEGKRCVLNADCTKGSCDAGSCDATEDVSGEFKLKIESVDVSGDNEQAAVVEKIKVSLDNGLTEAVNVRLDLYLLSSNRKNYLNQINLLAEEPKTYAEITVGAMTSGWKNPNQPYNLRDIKAFTGTKFVTAPGIYEPGDDFIIDIEAYDTRTGEMLDSASYTYKG